MQLIKVKSECEALVDARVNYDVILVKQIACMIPGVNIAYLLTDTLVDIKCKKRSELLYFLEIDALLFVDSDAVTFDFALQNMSKMTCGYYRTFFSSH